LARCGQACRSSRASINAGIATSAKRTDERDCRDRTRRNRCGPRRRRSTGTQTAQLSTSRKVLALGVMCVGFFIAYLDIQIVAASLKEIGDGLSASQDEIAWVQTSYP
jgi:hypothetical protein